MKTIKNYETYITAPKHVNIQKKNDNLIFKGPLGITLINLALYDKNGYSQYSLLLKKETSIIFLKCCNKAFFNSMLKIITDKIHVVLNGFLVALHVRGVGYRVEILNDEFNVEKYNSKLFPLNNNLQFPTLAYNNKKHVFSNYVGSHQVKTKQNNNAHICHNTRNTRFQQSRKNFAVGNSYTIIHDRNKSRTQAYSQNSVGGADGSSMEAGWLAKQALLHATEKTPVSLGSGTFQKNKESSLESTINRQTLFFKVGFSHDFKYICPSSVRVFIKQQTLICIYGIDRNQVSTIAAKIRMIKKPSVYKGKGIIFSYEKITLKHGKRK